MTLDEQVRVETMGMRLGLFGPDTLRVWGGHGPSLAGTCIACVSSVYSLLTRNLIIHGGRSLGLGSDYRDPTKYTTLNIRRSRCRGLDLSDSPSGSSNVGRAGRWFHRAVVH